MKELEDFKCKIAKDLFTATKLPYHGVGTKVKGLVVTEHKVAIHYDADATNYLNYYHTYLVINKNLDGRYLTEKELTLLT